MSNTTEVKKPFLTNVSYDVIKDVVTIYIPSLGVLYATLAAIWGLPFSIEVVGTLAAIEVFFGTVLKINSNRYQNQPTQYDGTLIANDPDPNNDTYRLEFDRGLVDMASQKEVRLKVVDLLPGDSH